MKYIPQMSHITLRHPSSSGPGGKSNGPEYYVMSRELIPLLRYACSTKWQMSVTIAVHAVNCVHQIGMSYVVQAVMALILLCA